MPATLSSTTCIRLPQTLLKKPGPAAGSRLGIIVCIFLFVVLCFPGRLLAVSAQDLIENTWKQLRGQASRGQVEMTIHRPSWERTLKMRSWTQGRTQSLIRILAPNKDKGNGTLKKGEDMWTYNPKINRVIKLPPSMMAQSWMGSDFSNNDLAKSDSILNDYTHRIVDTTTRQEQTVYIIESKPKPQAPVVWGSQKLKIREDFILLQETFFDEQHIPVKVLTTEDIKMLGGRLFPTVWIMHNSEKQDEFTRLKHTQLEFLDQLPPRLFTLRNLRNPGRL
ncbi:MAG: outer membrane lipoprotein-sorting protein [Thermodesulfobacteriota bacterium]